MHKIFLPIYYFFQKKKGLMYGLMIGTFIFFLFFGLKLRFEEEVIKLLPRSSMDNELAFSEVTLKDKIFIQLTASGENALSPRELGKYMDLFTAELMAQDTAGRYIAGILSRLDAELAIGAADYAFEHVPSFIDTAWYSRFDEVLRPEAIEIADQGLLPCTVELSCFMGSYQNYHVRTGDTLVKIADNCPIGKKTFHVGDHAYISFRSECAHLLGT